ncbi:MAG TPA: phospho-sugar mutase, partial [Acidimicrobiales bacterium]|nr:phospho-sugar mutase [Acidimicrobiales bacterium]
PVPVPVPVELRARAEAWMSADPDPATRAEMAELLSAGDTAALHERFDQPLTFGTAGIRGAMGAGPARINRLVVRRTATGLSRYLLAHEERAAERGVVVGRDARHGSAAFAAELAGVVSAHGLVVRSIERALPTPITAFAVRQLGAAGGAMVTASHNPASDNGVKVYVSDGAQVLPPDDEEISAAAALPGPRDLPAPTGSGGPRAGRVEPVDEDDLLGAYRAAALRLVEHGTTRELSVVYTPLHGVGGAIVPDLLVAAGFDAPAVVAAQAEPDPDFPTLAFPNPEEPGALDLAIADAARTGADIVLANDPDADRLAVAVPDGERGWRVLTGDEIGILLADHLVSSSFGRGRLVATTIVSSTMLAALAAERGVDYAETLTGFKWIARAAAGRPGYRLLFGYEEALGFAVSDAVADKDGMSAALVVADIAARAKASGETLADLLDDLSCRLGVHESAQWSLRLDGPDAPRAMAAIVERLRSAPPARLAGLEVTEVVDLAAGARGTPPTDAVVLRAGDRARVVVRPSGTEPKLKAYLLVTTPPVDRGTLGEARRRASALLAALRDDVRRLCGE